jgi:hypothetical protein
MELEDEETWLRHRVQRLRTILRLAAASDVEMALRELIIDAEERLDALATRRLEEQRT